MKRLIRRCSKNCGATQQENNATNAGEEEGARDNQDEIALTEIYWDATVKHH